MINCECGIQAKELKVKKAGPNQGRTFYACSKPMNEQCKFFEFATNSAPKAEGAGSEILRRLGDLEVKIDGIRNLLKNEDWSNRSHQ